MTTRNWDLEHAGCLVKFVVVVGAAAPAPTHSQQRTHTHIYIYTDTNRLTHIQNVVYTILAVN